MNVGKIICRLIGHKFWEDRWNGSVVIFHCTRCGYEAKSPAAWARDLPAPPRALAEKEAGNG